MEEESLVHGKPDPQLPIHNVMEIFPQATHFSKEGTPKKARWLLDKVSMMDQFPAIERLDTRGAQYLTLLINTIPFAINKLDIWVISENFSYRGQRRWFKKIVTIQPAENVP